MSWSIECNKAEIEPNLPFKEEIEYIIDNEDHSYEWLTIVGLDKTATIIYFDSDAMEHMDCLHDKRVLDLFKKHKVTGEIHFGSLEGDNAGEFWGYRFKDGEYTPLVGVLTYEEVK